MAIHADSGGSALTQTTGYFYNYFQHGLDFFLDDQAHKVRKIVVHSNIPGSPLFQRYKRCPWQLQIDKSESVDRNASSINFQSKIHDVLPSLSQLLPTASMHLDRLDDDLLALPDATTKLIGLDGIVFEVATIGYITSFTMF